MSRPRSFLDTIRRFRQMLRHFSPALRRQRGLIFGSFTALLASTALRLLEPWPLSIVLDRVFDRQQLAWLDNLSTEMLLLGSAVAVVLVSGIRSITDYLRTVGFALIGNRVVTQVRQDVYRHLQTLSLAFHSRAHHGDLVVRVTGDIHMLKDVAATAVLPLLASVTVLCAMFAAMFLIHPGLTLLAVGVLPVCGLVTLMLGRKVHAAAREQRRREGDLAATAAESISAIQVVQALSLEEKFNETFTARSHKSLKEGVKTSRLSARLERSVSLLIAVATALVLWYGGWLAQQGHLTPGLLVAFLWYLKRGLRPLQDFAKYSSRLAKATAAGERVVELLEKTPEVLDLPHAQPAGPIRGSIEFCDVDFSYGPDRTVLAGINFSIAPRERVALVGPSGIGKSTIVRLLLRLQDPTKGTVRIDGRDVRDWTVESLRRQVSVVLQESVLFAADVWENIACGTLDATREDVELAARLAGAEEFIQRLPAGYDTVLGERGVDLSHGQRQRIAIARAAVRQAPLLILDEPTSSLDRKQAELVEAALERLSKGRTTLWVTHDLHLAARADRILLLESGHIGEEGTHQQLLRRGGSYARLYQLQQGISQFAASHAGPN